MSNIEQISPTELEQYIAQQPVVDALVFKEFSALMGDECVEMLAVFVEDTAQRLERLLAVIADPQEVAATVHGIKSAAGSIGAARIFVACTGLEKNADHWPQPARQELAERLVALLEEFEMGAAL